ncbi:DNA-binding PadR family transcriptional regulator [Undibacterium sp. GrIS 1.8]|uniref:PadR family transcriptional regulator n=1 Tax=unclassified Undibacterium TaxID=2630295 RepID=UPI003395E8CA
MKNHHHTHSEHNHHQHHGSYEHHGHHRHGPRHFAHEHHHPQYFAGLGDDAFDDDAGGGHGRLRGGGGGGGGRGRGERAERVFGRGDLPLIVLALIEISPRHGYEIIKAIEERCGGAYAPSPGAIYPTLTLLEEQDQVNSQINVSVNSADSTSTSSGVPATGNKRLYTITAIGRDYLDANRAQVNGVLARLDMFAKVQAKQSLPERVHQAMHTLKHALMLRRGSWNAAEADRVAILLEQTANSIISDSNSEADLKMKEQ